MAVHEHGRRVRAGVQPVRVHDRIAARVVQARVRWVLTRDGREELGTDFFTIARMGDQFKIVSLVFHGD